MKIANVGANQTEVNIRGDIFLVSYSTTVAAYYPHTRLFIISEFKWSKTTTKHINAFILRNKIGAYQIEYKEQKYFDNIMAAK